MSCELGRLFGSALLVFFAILPVGAAERAALGPFGPEGPRMREQLWILPSGSADRGLRATVFRPDDALKDRPARRPLVVINHGTSEATRISVAMPVFYWLSRWFVERGYVVVLPQRRGHGATGGPLDEAIGTCADPDHFHSGLVAADDIEAVVDYMAGQPFVATDEIVVAGVSTGGLASLALASRNPRHVRAVLNFSGGRGGHAFGRMNKVCGEQSLIEAVRDYGRTARIPTIWFYAKNDSYFGPGLAHAMARAWKDAGGSVDLNVLPAYGVEGHDVSADQAGWDEWGEALAAFLDLAVVPGPRLEASAQPTVPRPLAVNASAAQGAVEGAK